MEDRIAKLKYKDLDFSWLSINEPKEEDIQYIRKNYKFHKLDLEDCLSEFQRPKIDDYEKYLFLVLHIPIKGKGKNKQIINAEINIFVGQNFLITLHDNNSTINKILEKCKKNKKIKEEYMSKGPGYMLYMIIDDLFESGFPLIDDLDKQLNDLEREAFDTDHSKDKLKDILLLKKDLINFRRIIMPERAIIAQLEHKNKKFLPENLNIYFDDIVDKIEKMWNSLENLQELAVSLQETNESIISHNTNNIIKMLTVISVIVLPLSFITGFYGMNVKLPLAEYSFATIIISGLCFALAVGMVIYFKVKNWI